MAKLIPPYLQIIGAASTKIVVIPEVLKAANIAGKLLRLVILIDRQRGYLGNVPVNGLDPNKEDLRDDIIYQSAKRNSSSDPADGLDPNKKNLRDDIIFQSSKRQTKKQNDTNQIFGVRGNRATATVKNTLGKDRIRIIDLDFNQGEGKTYDYIDLPCIPLKVSYKPTSKFAAIHTIGRNNPYYYYTGSEDTLSFKVDWYSEKYSREDVIYACRWLETLTKANGDDNPHRVRIMWGQDDKLYKDQHWLLTSAPYETSLFNRGYRDPKQDMKYFSTSLLPTQAYQDLEFKRITKDSLLYTTMMGGITNDHESQKNTGAISGGNTV